MGIYWLAYVVGEDCSDLSYTAYRILVKMALSALDDDDLENGKIAGIYYGGWKSLTHVLGHGYYDRNEPLPDNVERKIARGIRELREKDYIRDVPPAIARLHPTRRVYGLNTDRRLKSRNNYPVESVD